MILETRTHFINLLPFEAVYVVEISCICLGIPQKLVADWMALASTRAINEAVEAFVI
jgi:hypothetical protein